MKIEEQKLDEILAILQNLTRREYQPSNQTRFLTITEAADLLCKSIHTLYGMVSRRQIPHIKKGNRLYFREDHLRSWLEDGNRQTINELFTI